MTFIMPSNVWLRQTLGIQVRLGAHRIASLTPGVFSRGIAHVHYWSTNLPPLGQRIVAPSHRDNPTDAILSILLNGHFRKGSMAGLAEHCDHFRNVIAEHVRNSLPIQLVLPILPFKSQNPLATGHTPGAIDLGEYLLFAQLRSMIESIGNVYKPGMRVVLLCDGMIYADIFGGGNVEGIIRYFNANCFLNRALGLEKAVTLVDMTMILDEQEDFFTIREMIRDQLSKLSTSDPEVRHLMEALRQGMLLNVPFPEYDGNAFIEVLRSADPLPTLISERITEKALDYASLLIAMSYRNVIFRSFPLALRATVHPKAAPQLPLRLTNCSSGMSPHSGVPVVSRRKLERQGYFREATRIMYLCEAMTLPDLVAVHIDDIGGGREPFYYEVE